MSIICSNRRIVVIGLDGVSYSMVKDLSAKGVMPNMSGLIEEGAFRKMESSIPDISCVAWSSIITGKNPGEHSIYGFMDLVPGTYRLYFPNFTNLCGTPFWNWGHGRRSVIINVPSTYPAGQINGVLISGFVAPDLEKSVYPRSLAPELKRMDYRIDVDSEKGHQSLELFIDDLNLTLKARIEAYRYLWDKEDWNLFMLVFTGTDRLAHFLWEAYEDWNHPHHNTFLKYFSVIDEVIGEIAWRLGPEDSLVLLSDHGFERMDKTVYVNYYLRKNGFLTLKRLPTTSYDDISEGAKAFALEPASIHLNTISKYPRGSVREKDKEAIVEDLIDLFYSLKVEGEYVINRVYRKEEIYKGPFLDHAPDLVLMANRGFDLKARLHPERLFETTIFSGKHTHDDAFLLVKSPRSCYLPDNLGVCDVFRVIERLG